VFILPERTAILELLDTEYAGAEITVRLSVPLSVVKAISNRPADVDGIAEACAIFGDKVLVSWNLANSGGELPANGDGMAALDVTLITAIFDGWVRALRGTPAPLGEPSSDTAE
jgi:hypothetical protein